MYDPSSKPGIRVPFSYPVSFSLLTEKETLNVPEAQVPLFHTVTFITFVLFTNSGGIDIPDSGITKSGMPVLMSSTIMPRSISV